MGATPYANGGLLKRDLVLPDWKSLALDVPRPGGATGRGDARYAETICAT